MEIKITADQNSMTVQGYEYEFAEGTGGASDCEKCDFNNNAYACMDAPCSVNNTDSKRHDGKTGYFRLKEYLNED